MVGFHRPRRLLGTGALVFTVGGVAASGATHAHATILANEDDQVTNPTGNSGARVACGVIVAD